LSRKHSPQKGLKELQKKIKEISKYYPDGMRVDEFAHEMKIRGYDGPTLLRRLRILGIERGSNGLLYQRGKSP